MSLNVVRLDSIDSVNENQWNQVVEQSDLGSVFHRYEWVRAIEADATDETRHLVVEKKNNPIAIFPNVVVSLGRTPVRRLNSIRPGSVGPIAMTEEETALQLLLEAIPKICDGSILLNQLSNLDPEYVRYTNLLEEYGYDLRIDDCHFVLDLTRNWEELLEDMDSGRRRAIRSGHDREFEVRDEELTADTVAEFYDRYQTVAKRVGSSVLNPQFFDELRSFSERVKIFSLQVDEAECGMILFVLDDEQSKIHYLCSGVTEEDFQYNASELIHEHAIRWGIENGYEQYDFRGSEPDFRDGLFRFKEQFGGRAIPVLTWERGCPGPALQALHVARVLYRWYSS